MVDGLDLGGAQLLVAQRDRAYFRSSRRLPQTASAGSGGGRERHQREQRLLHGDAARDHRRRAGARQGAARARAAPAGPPSSGASIYEGLTAIRAGWKGLHFNEHLNQGYAMSLLRIYCSLRDTPQRCQWALVGDGREPVAGEGPLAQLPQRAERVQLVLPAARGADHARAPAAIGQAPRRIGARLCGGGGDRGRSRCQPGELARLRRRRRCARGRGPAGAQSLARCARRRRHPRLRGALRNPDAAVDGGRMEPRLERPRGIRAHRRIRRHGDRLRRSGVRRRCRCA